MLAPSYGVCQWDLKAGMVSCDARQRAAPRRGSHCDSRHGNVEKPRMNAGAARGKNRSSLTTCFGNLCFDARDVSF
jgi:hypothetical protein